VTAWATRTTAARTTGIGTGRRLSGARDAEAKLDTLSSLDQRLGDELPAGTIAALEQSLERERPENADEEQLEELKRAAKGIAQGRKRIANWPLKDGGWDLLEPGLQRSYRRGRKQMARTREDPSNENVHEWRKRVKDLWYQLRIVRNARPDLLGEAADRAHELSDILGDHHDLAVLADDVRDREEVFEEGIQRAALLSAISRRQNELLSQALAVGERLYAEKPRRFSKRLETYWTAWR
jgi:CHAD domain-containing protein